MKRPARAPRPAWRRPILLVMMVLALASRLALGATVPLGGAEQEAALDGLRAAMILCGPDGPQKAPPAAPHAPVLDDLLVIDLAGEGHALLPVSPSLPGVRGWEAVAFRQSPIAVPPRLWRVLPQPRGPPRVA